MLLTVITICLNDLTGLKKTVASVLEQTYIGAEYIIKDGNSADGTREYLETICGPHIIIQNDKGIYDAMNQALGEAHGQYILFMNAGDVFVNEDTLKEAAKFLIEAGGENIIYGNCYCDGQLLLFPSVLSKFYMFRTFLNHQSVFTAKKLFDKYGSYDRSYVILGDCDYHVRLFMQGVPFIHYHQAICCYEGGGASSDFRKNVFKREHRKIQKKYFSCRQNVFYSIAEIITVPRLRVYLGGKNAPQFVRRIYRKLVNLTR